MKAARYSKRGNPSEVIEVVDVDPQPMKPTSVRCKVLAAPINPSDILAITGLYAVLPPLPAVGGFEGIGRIVETGAEVSGLQPGQLVTLGGGTWRSEMVLPASAVIPLPQGDPLQLAMLLINPPTAWLMLRDYVDLNEGDWIIQNASNSGVGGYVIQLAKQRGIRTVNVVRREGLEEALRAKGADVVIVDGPDLAARVRAATGGVEPRLGLDAVAGEATLRLADCVAPGGTVVCYGAMSLQPCQISPLTLFFRSVSLRGFWLQPWLTSAPPDERQAVYGTLARMLIDGTLAADIGQTYPLERAKEALAHADAGGRSGKILITPTIE